jgi:hypothetical protein
MERHDPVPTILPSRNTYISDDAADSSTFDKHTSTVPPYLIELI